MKLLTTSPFLFSILIILIGCQTSRVQNKLKPKDLVVSGSIEITECSIEQTSSDQCTVMGKLVDENAEAMVGMTAVLSGTQKGAACDLDGRFKLENIAPGSYRLELTRLDAGTCSVEINLEEGDQLNFEAIIAMHIDVELLKPVIYLYPEKKVDVEVKLVYDGKITTTYPKYPEGGWKVTASPDGTLFDANSKEYYALYWEGKPRKPLGINDGFVVSKEETIPFLEEKLNLLGLNAKEANEFIIFWLPILEQNDFNLIHFAGDAYLNQARLSISPTPTTTIRIAMVFKGLDEERIFPVQDLTPLYRKRNGFTVVEWGGQQLPKDYVLEI